MPVHAYPKHPGLISVRGWLAGPLAILCVFLAGVTAFILYELNLRKHDYQILNLAGQMRVLASTLHQQAEQFLGADVLRTGTIDESFMEFERQTADTAVLYQRIIQALADRELPADLIGRDAPLRCNWDRRSRNQLDVSVAFWRRYQLGLEAAKGTDPAHPHTLAMAGYMVANGPALVASTEELARAFQSMMEGKLRLIRALIVGMLAGAVGVTAIILVLMRQSVLRPLERTVAGFARVAAGDLGFQVEEAGTLEFSRMTRAFNDLSVRLHGMFELIDHIGRGSTLAETMAFVVDEFRRFVPVDGLALLVGTPEGKRYVVESVNGAAVADWPEIADPILAEVVSEQRSHVVEVDGAGPGALVDALRQRGLTSALLLPLASVREGGAILAVMSRKSGAYSAEHRQFLGIVGAQVDTVLSRTLVMDGLVVAAVQGLAKLAESRDPETGDHLVRMSLYSMVIAEELSLREPYRSIIDRDYVRSLHRFAPMHDIGKVGIPDRVLLKPGRLDDDERREMNLHPRIGAEVLKLCEQRMNELGRSVFRIGIEIAESHHEKWDGSGYPYGRAGAAIPLSARIVAVADVFDALTSKRPYKDAWSLDDALGAIRKDAGSHFDPDVVDAFFRAIPRVIDVYDRFKHV
ncbi:MAG: HD domain-containing protein [Magnetospirillum sp.]|nr:HD domain-containing protein [Magnetospirillum sp.]